jgi:alpha-D-ribose 1-methylphosphonate 5-triphosphate synthase subunit PhnG
MPATLAGIIKPLQAEAASEKAARAAKAAGTKVEFFTMVRGDNT